MEAQSHDPNSLLGFAQAHGFKDPFSRESMAAFSRKLQADRVTLAEQFNDATVEELHVLGPERLKVRIGLGQTATTPKSGGL